MARTIARNNNIFLQYLKLDLVTYFLCSVIVICLKYYQTVDLYFLPGILDMGVSGMPVEGVVESLYSDSFIYLCIVITRIYFLIK